MQSTRVLAALVCFNLNLFIIKRGIPHTVRKPPCFKNPTNGGGAFLFLISRAIHVANIVTPPPSDPPPIQLLSKKQCQHNGPLRSCSKHFTALPVIRQPPARGGYLANLTRHGTGSAVFFWRNAPSTLSIISYRRSSGAFFKSVQHIKCGLCFYKGIPPISSKKFMPLIIGCFFF